MSARNNEDRFSAPQPDLEPPAQALQQDTPQSDPFSFVVPTEFVSLPSRGALYPSNSPLRDQETIEIKFMTAKEEDILTSKSLLEKGLALDRLINNLIVDKSINAEMMLSGDRNAVLIAARRSGYGEIYTTKIACPSCGEAAEYDYNLNDAEMITPDSNELREIEGLNVNSQGNFTLKLKVNPVTVEFKLLTGREENRLLKVVEQRKRKKQPEQLVTEQLKQSIVSVNGHDDRGLLGKFAESMTVADTRYLREVQNKVTPNIEMRKEFVCDQCGHEDEINFPFTTDFFWPQ